ncbi:hypothetical protein EC973_009545 [Apophysomyces ossiformis]|uniref:ATP-dependent bile acid permease n=1 Tax=Apophysomyces ossiformis TaxID=679940 RepID=A0A8H7BLE7_9FUNG|nr:hypothetical protein EC973_009545 [Apophysomyces ossiformis]
MQCRTKTSRRTFAAGLARSRVLRTSGPYVALKRDRMYPSYGTTRLEDDSNSSLDVNLKATYIHQCKRWTSYNIFRFGIPAAELCTIGYALYKIKLNEYDLDKLVEGGSLAQVKITYIVRAMFWAYALVLGVTNIVLSVDSYKPMPDMMCRHLNLLGLGYFLLSLVDLRSFYLVHTTELTMGYAITVVSTSLVFLFLLLIIHEERYAPRDRLVSDTEGSKRTLNDEDLIELPPENRAINAHASYKRHSKTSMAWGLLKTFRKPLSRQFVYCIIWSLAMFGPPYFLNKVIKYIENADPAMQVPASTAFLYVLGLFISSSVQSLSYQQALYIGRTLGIRIQSIVIGEVYGKALRRRDESGKAQAEAEGEKRQKGNVNNLLSVDAQKMGELTAYIFYMYCFPLQVSICVWSLYRLLGAASLYGVFIMFVSQPVTYFLSRRFQRLHHVVMGYTDRRIKLMNELLSAIRIVKFFAWEKEFKKRLFAAREDELKAIKSRLFMLMWMSNAWFLIPVLIMVAVFYMYTKTYSLTASTAFTALALFNTFKTTLDELPIITSFILQANVSLGRVETFLREQEVQEADHATTEIGFFDNAAFSWGNPDSEEVKVALKDLNLTFPRNKLSIVCGPTGSGKTTLLASLLGETYCISGSAKLPRKSPSGTGDIGSAVSGVAYVAQTAWLQNCSIKDNILFGLPYDEERYQKVLYMTALTRDLEILKYGDSTEIGEKGITLSGGQKQRVAIARAVYSQADIVILDDCLSAVDAYTAKHLYEKCLTGDLMYNRTVILVTHHVALCLKKADYVVALQEGRVVAAGEPSSVLKMGVLGEDLGQTEDQGCDELETGPIPIVAKYVNKQSEDGAGKLTKAEHRAEGGVSWSVYATYFYASGGYIFWFGVLVLFCCAQAVVLGQDYWIRIWSASHDSEGAKSIKASALFPASFIPSSMPLRTMKLDWPIINSLESIQEKESIDNAWYVGIYFLIGLTALLMTTLRQLTLFMGSLRASRRIHNQLLERILRARVRFFDSTPLGRILNRFSSDLETIDQSVAPSLSVLLFSIIATLCVVILVSAITPAFIVPGAFIAVLYWKIGTYYLRTSRDMKRLNSVSRSPIYVQFSETINGVTTIRAFGCQMRFIQENFRKIDSNSRPFIWMWATNRWLHCRVELLGAFVGFCTGVVLIMSRSWVAPGLAGLSLSYALTFTHHVLWVVRMYAINEMNMNSIERVHEYLDVEEEAPAHIPESLPPPSWPETGSMKVENLSISYAPDSPAVLRGISFETRAREKIGIVGRTGSGKSTLALSIFRFMESTSGRILIDGVDISTIGLEDLRSRLTIIPQDPILFSGTLRNNLDPFGQHDDAELWAALKRTHLIESKVDAQFGLDATVAENGSNWSQGQRQLIALARALVKKSSLIILDEATSSVDFDTDYKIQQTIRTEFVHSSLLCIAHRIRTVADYDRILVLDNGLVVEFDSPYSLMTREDSMFRELCERSGEYAELLSIAKANETYLKKPMSTTYTPGLLSSALLGDKTDNLNNDLDAMFKNSAGPSKAAEKPDLQALKKMTVTKPERKIKKSEMKSMAKKAEEAAKKARALQSLPPLDRKRKAGAIEEDSETGAKKKMNAQETEEEKKEKAERTIFLGNVPIECSEKAGEKELRRKFREFGEIESVRFRSVAFSQLMSRKAAFISKKLHDERTVMNAYIVYKNKEACEKALAMNGQLFMGKHLRVDGAVTAKQYDRKRSVFLGSLPFEVEEEELWDHFKDCGEIESIRVVRDSKTNIGKGFGYVQFKERVSVDLALALEDKKLAGKHKIRIQRCKVPVSEGGERSKPAIKKKSGRVVKGSKKSKSSKVTGPIKRYEGTRATKEDGKKMKLKKIVKKAKGTHKK